MRRAPSDRLRALSLCLALGLSACGDSDSRAPTWIELARIEDPARLRIQDPASFQLDGRAYEYVRADEGAWLRLALTQDDWRKDPSPGRWRMGLPLGAIGAVAESPSGVRLEDAEGPFLDYDPNQVPRGSSRRIESVSRSFLAFNSILYMQLEPSEKPPERMTLSFAMSQGAVVEGRSVVRGRRFTGEGFSVLPGARTVREVDLPARSMLRFATCVEPAVTDHEGTATAFFRVRLDGEVLFEHAQEYEARGASEWHRIPLPDKARGRAELSFEVEGDFAFTSFLSPRIAPAATGTREARPWKRPRPDIVVFLADTFRADNMALYGGTLGLTPNLDRFAGECRSYLRAWATGTNTLPSHASLFTGLFPLQTGVVGHGSRLPEEVRTLAEILSDRGYRTAAITDGGVVSRVFGMSQGFQYFDESRRDIEDTLASTRSLLDDDDGRPLFLFVHTYRAHTPYRVSDRTLAARGTELGIEGTYEEWFERLEEPEKNVEKEQARAQRRAVVEGMRRLYHGGVVDLDLAFQTFLDDLRARRIFSNGYLLVTSDHGEAFYEHRGIFHSGPVYEEEVRIPMLLHGPGIQPAEVQHAASLADITPTLLELAGIAAGQGFLSGRSLLELDEDRPMFLFQCREQPERSTVGLIRGSRKIISSEAQLAAGTLGKAFDLESDPGELRDLVSAGEGWPAELLESLTPRALELCQPLFDSQASVLDETHQAEMRALGYLGEE